MHELQQHLLALSGQDDQLRGALETVASEMSRQHNAILEVGRRTELLGTQLSEMGRRADADRAAADKKFEALLNQASTTKSDVDTKIAMIVTSVKVLRVFIGQSRRSDR